MTLFDDKVPLDTIYMKLNNEEVISIIFIELMNGEIIREDDNVFKEVSGEQVFQIKKKENIVDVTKREFLQFLNQTQEFGLNLTNKIVDFIIQPAGVGMLEEVKKFVS